MEAYILLRERAALLSGSHVSDYLQRDRGNAISIPHQRSIRVFKTGTKSIFCDILAYFMSWVTYIPVDVYEILYRRSFINIKIDNRIIFTKLNTWRRKEYSIFVQN